MIIRHKKLPDMEFEVSSHEEAGLAHRVIREMTGGGSLETVLPGTPSPPPQTGNHDDPIPGTVDAPAQGSPGLNPEKVVAALGGILWSFDVSALIAVRAGRTRRTLIEKQFSSGGHSFNKFKPRVEKAAVAAGGGPADLLLGEPLGTGFAKETWFEAGPLLAAIPLEMLERLEAQLKSKEKEKEAKRASKE